MEENRLQASHMLQSSLQSNGDRRYATPPQQIAAFNRNAVPQYKDTAPHSYAPAADIIYGEDVYHVSVLSVLTIGQFLIVCYILDFQYRS